ncbi:MAG: Uma2 family endonuclease [Saprospiraceae bacterium]
MIIEILSPGNSKKEMKDKFELYEEAGVLEYWIVDPEHKVVHAYHLSRDTGKFTAVIPALTDEDTLTSIVFEGLQIPLATIFTNDDN